MVDQLYEKVKNMDSTDPSAMDKIREFLITLDNEDEEFMLCLVNNIGGIEIYWDRPWYQLSKSLTRPLKQEKNNDDELEETFKVDSMSSDEINKVNKNWQKLIKKFDIPDKPLCFARWRNTMRQFDSEEEKARYFVTAYLARGLRRTLYHVYRHIVTYYGAPVKGYYSAAEEKIMDICFYHNPYSAVTVCARLLSREPRGLYNKLEINRAGKLVKKKRLKWTLPTVEKFIKLLMEYTGLPLEQLKNRRFDKDVWLRLEEDMDQYYVNLQQFWYKYLHVQFFVKDYVIMRRLRKKLYKILKLSSYKIWSDIRWKEVQKMFPDGFTHYFLYVVAYRGLSGHPDFLKVPLQDLIEYGLSNLIKYKNVHRKVLRNLTLDKKGNVTECIKHYKCNKKPK